MDYDEFYYFAKDKLGDNAKDKVESLIALAALA